MTQKDEIRQIQNWISGLKRRKRFVRWGESRRLAGELLGILDDLESQNPDPCLGAKIVASFFETDEAIMGHCDDSSGYVGDVYRGYARDLFLRYATRCEDKAWLADLLLSLNQSDPLGVRDSLIRCAGQYLSEPEIRYMIDTCQNWAKAEMGEWEKRHWFRLIEDLAREIGDAPLFEKVRTESWGETGTAACIDIAEVYFETGDAETALSWLEKIPEDEAFQEDERDDLLIKVFGRLGEGRKQVEVAWRVFRRRRCKAGLDDLVAILGEDKRDWVIEKEVDQVLAKPELSLVDAAFLFEMRRFEQAEAYLLGRHEELDGDRYDHLLPMAEAMEAAGHSLGASAMYRALIDSILKKARSKIYHYAVRYLKKLELHAARVSDWGPIATHDQYFAHLEAKHGRKTAFWKKYEKARF